MPELNTQCDQNAQSGLKFFQTGSQSCCGLCAPAGIDSKRADWVWTLSLRRR